MGMAEAKSGLRLLRARHRNVVNAREWTAVGLLAQCYTYSPSAFAPTGENEATRRGVPILRTRTG